MDNVVTGTNCDGKALEHYSLSRSYLQEAGMNSTNDMLSLSLEKMIRKSKGITKLTKRSTISFASKLFDLLGYVEPITVKAKIMIQNLWKQNLSWDEDVPSEHKRLKRILRVDYVITLPDTRVSVKESDPDYIPTDISTKELMNITLTTRKHQIKQDSSCYRRRCSHT